ncbi:MAG TPA: LuxR C-terminal-related transcriptional regulator [Coleofasciculaceae cyanobacterium]
MVKERQSAIANSICGFAGLPLTIAGEAVGVLAVFSHQSMEVEFLEALRILCSSVAVALNNAQLYQQELTVRARFDNPRLWTNKPLCEQISVILTNIALMLVEKKHPLSISGNYILLKTAEVLQVNRCNYCRLSYESDRLYLEAMLSNSDPQTKTAFEEITAAITNMGGKLSIDTNDNIIQVQLSLPYRDQPKLTASVCDREQEVIQLLAKGMRDRQIAQKLFISDRTLKFHVNNAVNKLNSRTRIQAIHQAYSQGYLSQNLN